VINNIIWKSVAVNKVANRLGVQLLSQVYEVSKGVFWGLIALATLIIPWVCHANQMVEAKSPHYANGVLKVVYVSDKGDAEEKPGIYHALAGETKNQAIVHGTVLDAGKNFNGIRYFSPLSKETGRLEFMAVVNGRICFFSGKSTPAKKDSFFCLGSKQTPVLDVVTRSPVRIADLTSIKQINVISTADVSKGSSKIDVALISIDQPNPLGTGYTIAVTLLKPSGGSVVPLEMRMPPVVIDYNFLQVSELSKLVSTTDKNQVFSRLYLQQLSQVQSTDDPALVKWRASVAFFADYLRPASGIKLQTVLKKLGVKEKDEISSLVSIPYFNLDDPHGRLTLDMLPFSLISDSALHVVNRANPVSGENSIIIAKNEGGKYSTELGEPGYPALLNGKIDYDHAKKKYRIFSFGEEQCLTVFFMNGKPRLVFKDEDDDEKFYSVDLGDMIPVDATSVSASYYRVEDTQVKNVHNYYFAISYKTGQKKETFILQVKELNGICNIIKKRPIGPYFARQEELETRFYEVEEEDFNEGKRALIYDDVTVGETKKEIEKRRKSTTVLLDIANTRPEAEKWKEVYVESLNTSSLPFPGIIYHQYDANGASQKFSGFYITDEREDKTKAPSFFIPAEPLTLARKKKDTNIMGGGDLEVPNTMDKMRREEKLHGLGVGVMALNPKVGKDPDTKRMQIMVYVYGEGGDQQNPYIPTYEIFDLPVDYRKFKGAKVIQHRRKHANKFTVLFFFEGEKKEGETESGKEGVYAYFGQIGELHKEEKIGKTPIKLLGSNKQWVTKDPVDLDSTKYRIVFDKTGQLYWVNSPQLTHHQRHYSIVSFEDGTKVYPSRSGSGVSVKPDEVLKGGLGKEAKDEYYYGSQWHIYFPSELTQRIKELEKYIQDKEKSEAKAKKEEATFPRLQAYLDEIATPQPSAQHEVILVEPGLRQNLMMSMMSRLSENKDGYWSLVSSRSQKVRFHIFDPNTGLADSRHEYKRLVSINRRGERGILFIDLKEILDKEGIEVVEHTDIKEDEGSEGDDDDDDDDVIVSDEDSNESPTKKSKTVKKEEEDDEEEDEKGSKEDEDEESADNRKFNWLQLFASEGGNIAKSNLVPGKYNPTIPAIVLATPSEWRALEKHYLRDKDSQALKTFKVNRSFLTSSWTVWPPNSPKASTETRASSKAPISVDEYKVFPDVEQLLLKLVDPKVAPDHNMLVIPEELKPLLKRLIITRWATDNKALVQQAWNYHNHGMHFFQLAAQEGVSQELLMDNYDAMRGGNTAGRSVLLADMHDVLKLGRPGSVDGKRGFYLKDPNAGRVQSQNLEVGESASPTSQPAKHQLPHALWLMMSEGKKVQPGKSKDWTLRGAVPPEIPLVLLATEKDLAALENEMGFEQRFLDFRKHFKVTKLERPSLDIRRQLLHDLFNRTEIASLGYTFKHESFSSEEAKRQLIAYMVGRIDHISNKFGLEPTTGFIRVYSEFRKALIEDVDLRRNRVIDRFYLERLYTRVFSLPLSLEILPEHDPLKKLKDVDAAALRMADHNFEGPLELKRHVISGINSVTRAGDDGRRIPSSFILFGSTSTGKTYLFETLVRMMGLKMYDFNNPNDDEAGAFHLRVKPLVETDNGGGGQLSVDKAIEHLNNFLASPRGNRGMILIDDLHNAGNTKILQKLLAYLQSLFEAPEGMVRVKRMSSADGVYKDIPVRNLHLFVTLNPQPDKEILDRFVGDDTENLVKQVIAALSRSDDFAVEESMVARVSHILNMDKFPREAKMPSLVKRVRKANQDEFSATAKLLAVSPEALDKVVQAFPSAHAREFLSNATGSILSRTEDAPKATIYVVDPVHAQYGDYTDDEKEPRGGHTDNLDSNIIDNTIKKLTVVRPITSTDINSLIRFLSFIIDNFRVSVYQYTVLEATQNKVFSRELDTRRQFLSNILLASMFRLSDFSSVPLKHIPMRWEDFGIPGERSLDDFKGLMKKETDKNSKFFPVSFDAKVSMNAVSLDRFLQRGLGNDPSRTRLDVMKETSSQIEELIRELFQVYFSIPGINAPLETASWIQGLPTQEPREVFKNVSKRLLDIYREFMAQMQDSRLREIAESKSGKSMTNYDSFSLFLLCLDQAIVHMPWARMTTFLVSSMEMVSRDISLGQSEGFQNYVFKNVLSPFSTLTVDHVAQVAEASEVVHDIEPNVRERFRIGFHKNCADYFILNSKISEEP